MKPKTQRSLRQIHHIIGLFFAPMIMLFTISGALQTFRLQEVKGYGGTPPDWVVWMASVHKDQRLPIVKPAPPAEAGKQAIKPPMTKPAEKKHSTLPLKIFVAILAVGLLFSTLTGITIALVNRAMRRMSIMLLIAGTVVPLLLLYL